MVVLAVDFEAQDEGPGVAFSMEEVPNDHVLDSKDCKPCWDWEGNWNEAWLWE